MIVVTTSVVWTGRTTDEDWENNSGTGDSAPAGLGERAMNCPLLLRNPLKRVASARSNTQRVRFQRTSRYQPANSFVGEPAGRVVALPD